MANYITKPRRDQTASFLKDNFKEIHDNYDNEKIIAESSKVLVGEIRNIVKRSSPTTCFGDGISMDRMCKSKHKHQKVDFENSIYQNNRKLVKIKF